LCWRVSKERVFQIYFYRAPLKNDLSIEMFPGGIPKKQQPVGWFPQAAATPASADVAMDAAPAPSYAYSAAVPGLFNRYKAANTAASQAITWPQVAYQQPISLHQAQANLASRLGYPQSSVMAKEREKGTYFTVQHTGSQGQPQETHYSMHQPSQWGSTSVGQFHMRTHNTNPPRERYEARAVPTAPAAQGGPFGFGSFVTPKSNFNRAQRGQPGFYPYPQGHPVVTTIAPALAQTAASYQQGAYSQQPQQFGFAQQQPYQQPQQFGFVQQQPYQQQQAYQGQPGLFGFPGARGGQEGKRRRRAKTKKQRKAKGKSRKH
jgi:hypothetical protein